MSTSPNQGQNPDPSKYGGYTGYTPPNPADDPYGSYSQSSGAQQSGAGYQGSDPNYVYGQQGQQQQYASGGQQQQQYNTYQPPQSVGGVGGKNAGANSPTSLGMTARMEALLSYLFICFSGLVFFFLERKNSFVRYNAAQSIVVFGPFFIVYTILKLIVGITSGIFLIGGLFGFVFGTVATLLGIVFGLLWVYLLIQAYRGVTVRLPYASVYTDALLKRFGGGKV